MALLAVIPIKLSQGVSQHKPPILKNMYVTTYNGFKGFYVAKKSTTSFDGLKLYYWAETVEECEKFIEDGISKSK